MGPQFPVDEQIRRFGFSWDSVGSFGPYLDFWSFHQLVIQSAPAGSTIVEIGTYHGQGLICLGLLAREANKGIKIVGVDNNSMGANASCKVNLRAAGLSNVVRFVDGDSASVATQFADDSVWCAFIDGGHLHDIVESDVRAWMPKVSNWLCGHDFMMYTVHQPILNLFPTTTIFDPRWDDIWIVPKQEVPEGVNIRNVPDKYPNRTTWKP